MAEDKSASWPIWGVCLAGAIPLGIGAFWLAACLSGVAARWWQPGLLPVKTNLALALLLAGTALLLLRSGTQGGVRRVAGLLAAGVVLAIGALTLSEHLLGIDLGIDQLLAAEAPGGAPGSSPNRAGVPGLLGLLLVGGGLIGLAWRRRVAPYLGLTVCVLELVPLVGFAYSIKEFRQEVGWMENTWPTALALMALGTGLVLASRKTRPLAVLWRKDSGGALFRGWLPVVVLVPLVLGFLVLLGRHLGLYGAAVGTGLLVLSVVLVFTVVLWRSALYLSLRERTESQAKEQLRQSEERYRTLFETMAEGFCTIEMVFDSAGKPVDYRFLEVNPAFIGQTGLQAAQGRLMRELAPDHEAHWFEVYGKVARTGQPAHFESEAKALGRYYEVSACRVGGPQSRKVAVLFTDITERRRAEAAVRESERLFRTAFENGAIGMALTAPDGRLLKVNSLFCRMLGFAEAELVGRSFAAITHPEDLEASLGGRQQLCQGEVSAFRLEKRYLRKDGTLIWGDMATAAVCDAPGQPRYFVTHIQDITERKLAQEKLRRAEVRLAQAVRLARLGIFEHEHQTDVLECSPLLREWFGFAPREALSVEGILARVLPEDRAALAAAIQRAHDPAGNGSFEVEYRIPSPKGAPRWLSARSQTFFAGQGNQRRPLRTIGAVLEVTERKAAQAALERLVAERTAQLQEVVGELEHCSYPLTHDLRAPLRGLRGFAELLGQSCGAEPQAQGLLRRIQTSTARMDSLITDALNFNRAVREELALAPVDAGALLRGMLESYPELQPSQADVQLQGEFPPVLANEPGLTQCFSNLLGNAVKFVRPGQKPVIRIRAEPRQDWVRLWVEDQGIGVPAPMLPRVFDMFSRGHQNYEGTGIGLALVRKVTERMGGKVGVESEEGRGSRFWLELRKAESGTRPARSSTKERQSQGAMAAPL